MYGLTNPICTSTSNFLAYDGSTPTKIGLAIPDQRPSSNNVIGQSVADGNQKDTASATARWAYSHSICFLASSGES